MAPPLPDFSDLRAVYVNGSLKYDAAASHTMRLVRRSAGIMHRQGVEVDIVHALDHEIAFGMVTDATEHGRDRDDWPDLQARIMAADILVLGTPIWLGEPSSVTALVIERMYAHSGERNDRGQYLYYGKVGGCIVTGNEDGVKACSKQLLYAMQHIGYSIPPQADCGWIGEVGPGASYGDPVEGSDRPAGYDSDFTNRNTTIMTYNLLHLARLLRDAGGFPVGGNAADHWTEVPNAADQDPDAVGR
jgi:multimeric flavodoxin WrbA